MPDAFADLAPRMDFRLPLLLAMLLLVAYPAYTDYHARGKTSEVLAALMPARAALVRQIGSLPADADLRTLALPAPDSPWLVTARPLVLTQPTTSRVRLAARLSGIHPALEQRFLVWEGELDSGRHSIRWQCVTDADSTAWRHLPEICRHAAGT